MAEKPTKDGRTRKGTFAKGNRLSVGNKGNTSISKARELHAILMQCVDAGSLKKIVEKMVKQAEKGDKDARKECFERLWGKAKQSIEHMGSFDLPPIRIQIVKEDRAE